MMAAAPPLPPPPYDIPQPIPALPPHPLAFAASSEVRYPSQPREVEEESLRKLEWFYRRFNPGKVVFAQQILLERGADQSGMWQELGRKYEGGQQWLEWYEVLTRFYREFNPRKAPLAGAILEEWQGREAKLFSTLERKYGSSPSAPGAAEVEEFLRKVYTQQCPEMLPYIPSLLTMYSSRLHELAETVAAKYNVPLPTQPLPAVPVQQSAEGVANEVLGAVGEVGEVLKEKNTLIQAQMTLIDDYATQLEQRREETAVHTQTIQYLRHLHSRAQLITDRLGKNLSQLWRQHPSQDREGTPLAAEDLKQLCNVLGLPQSEFFPSASQQQSERGGSPAGTGEPVDGWLISPEGHYYPVTSAAEGNLHQTTTTAPPLASGFVPTRDHQSPQDGSEDSLPPSPHPQGSGWGD